jgi:hypothetical protein
VKVPAGFLYLSMGVESELKKGELKREIVSLWLEMDGQYLEKLTIAELKEVLQRQTEVNNYVKQLNKAK